MDIDLKPLTKLAIETAIEAGQLVKGLRASGVDIDFKGPVDLVTSADIASQELIAKTFLAEYPDISVVAEESDRQKADTRYYWLVDPLDGTTNYAHGFPIYCVSIALMEDTDSLLGVVFDPNMDELFVASKEEPSSLNGVPIHVSDTSDIDKSLLATGFPYDLRKNPQPTLEIFNRYSLIAQGIRRAGAAALDLCYLACGRIDGFWESGLKPWDTAAAGFIAESAGAISSDYSGQPFDLYKPEALFSNGFIHDRMLQEIADLS